MAKYARGPVTRAVYMADEMTLGLHAALEPVIVLPEAEWRELVRLMTELFQACNCCDTNCKECQEDAALKAIIQRTEAENNG